MTFEKWCNYFKINQNEMDPQLDKILGSLATLLKALDSKFDISTEKWQNENKF